MENEWKQIRETKEEGRPTHAEEKHTMTRHRTDTRPTSDSTLIDMKPAETVNKNTKHTEMMGARTEEKTTENTSDTQEKSI